LLSIAEAAGSKTRRQQLTGTAEITHRLRGTDEK
jgi:hypothetical protein